MRPAVVAGQLPQHDRGARERQEQSDEDRRAAANPERLRNERHGCRRQAHLQRPAREHRFPDASQFNHRKLEADGEQQQHDADLCELLDVFGAFDHPERRRSGQDTGGNERNDGRNPEAACRDDDAQRHGVDENQFRKKAVRHASIIIEACRGTS
jgi:hypothetical protein